MRGVFQAVLLANGLAKLATLALFLYDSSPHGIKMPRPLRRDRW